MKNRNFDIMLVPVIEHVDNVQDFLKTLANIKASKIIITVPDAFFLCSRNHFKSLIKF